MFKNQKMKKIKITVSLALALVMNMGLHAQKNMYPKIAEDYFILQGDKCSWDADAVHTFSVVEANRDGYKYWGYYGLDKYEKDEHARKGGLVRSNDLVNWTKYEYNPVILSNCRWPTVVISNGIFYMYYAEYNKPNDSRIVMMESKNGIDFENKTIQNLNHLYISEGTTIDNTKLIYVDDKNNLLSKILAFSSSSTIKAFSFCSIIHSRLDFSG